VLLLVAVALLGAAWTLFVPPWQSPDEPSHFGYVQSIGERFALPGEDPGRPYSREQDLAVNRSNSLQTQANLIGRPEWSEAELRDWQWAGDRLGTGARGDVRRRIARAVVGNDHLHAGKQPR